jgi:glutamine synthetase
VRGFDEATAGLGAGRADRAGQARRLADRLRGDGVEGVILSFVDTAGINRIKTVPVARLQDATSWGVGASPVFDTFLADDSATATSRLGGPDGDLRLVPDLGQLTVLAAQPGWAWAPADRYTQDGAPYPACQRLFAAAMAGRARAAGLRLRMSFEVEWVLGRDTGDDTFVPVSAGPAYGMTRLVDAGDYARDVLTALRRQGIEVEQFHPEYAPGQYEVSVSASEPVAAADRSILVRQTLRAVAARHGYRVSFSPAVVPGQVGNGGHVHLSVWRDGANLFAGGTGRYAMTAPGEAFAAGILALLPALLAVGAPVPASYLRLVPSRWAGAFACWGHETREAALRLVTGSAGREAESANLEVKCFDLAANPYLLVGCLIAAGLHGIGNGDVLPGEITGDPAGYPPERLGELGVRRLPRSLDESADALAADGVLREAMGDTLCDAVLAVRRAEAERLRGKDDEAVAAAARWVY